jgi:hypothetical protein
MDEERGYVVRLHLTLEVHTDGPPYCTNEQQATEQALDTLRVINKSLGRDKLQRRPGGVSVRRMTEDDE